MRSGVGFSVKYPLICILSNSNAYRVSWEYAMIFSRGYCPRSFLIKNNSFHRPVPGKQPSDFFCRYVAKVSPHLQNNTVCCWFPNVWELTTFPTADGFFSHKSLLQPLASSFLLSTVTHQQHQNRHKSGIFWKLFYFYENCTNSSISYCVFVLSVIYFLHTFRICSRIYMPAAFHRIIHPFFHVYKQLNIGEEFRAEQKFSCYFIIVFIFRYWKSGGFHVTILIEEQPLYGTETAA